LNWQDEEEKGKRGNREGLVRKKLIESDTWQIAT